MNFEILKGKTLKSISAKPGTYEVTMVDSLGHVYKMDHQQDCCESVELVDVCGEIDDVIGSPILLAEEVTNSEDVIDGKPEYPDSFTWTFYKLSTIRGSITMRWLGESNGYYSESVDFYREDLGRYGAEASPVAVAGVED